MRDVIKKLLSTQDGIALVEYEAKDHPELIFYEIVKGWKDMGIEPLIVDIWDTLHIFIQNLRFAGIELEIGEVPVIKEKGIVMRGNVLGRVDIIEDFEHHLAIYGQVAKNVPERSRNHTIVLGMEKFSFTFLDNPAKLERYFETVTRRYLPIEGKMNFLFLNTSIASEYLTKGLEQDSDYVLRVSGRTVKLIKHPGVGENEI
ncbi:DUF257 family protein [Thermococcus thioreducens]|uniref:Uncharacterized protein n=1 Tax=Thermococcus thioreducens TaxID=277988 RepID=A0A0Q2RDA2_9EURY|nr:DUF257 family protein [Thermococcus thioreducens]ASJ11464.1 hypothetical protein A3L14_00545 [Thermococcus thioreducens]KQH81918.1 hypothetical protein AMR53_09280 [Thermococcus thioreducens]SEW06230.1 protein of unknown function, DUF257 [Thermococcus thioreducens]